MTQHTIRIDNTNEAEALARVAQMAAHLVREGVTFEITQERVGGDWIVTLTGGY